MIVDSNSPGALKYTDPTFQALLFVRANIYDTSGVSPSLESTVNLALIDNGVYWGKYTFTAAKTYLVQKLVYTDGTYTVVDTTFAQDNDDVQCINLHTANLDASVSSRNSTAHFDAILGTPAVSIAADIAEVEGETDALTTAVAAIPTTPVLTAHFDTVIGSPAGASIAADLAEIEGETDGIAAIPTNPLLTNDARLNHLDADVSSRLATAGYTAPDNADIIAIKAKTDNLPVDPTSTAVIMPALVAIDNDVLTRVSTGHFDGVIGVPAGASIAADIAEIELETDGLASQASVNAIATTLGTPAGASIAADIAEVEAETDAISTLETDASAATREATILAAISGGSSVAVLLEDNVIAEIDESLDDINAESDESDDL